MHEGVVSPAAGRPGHIYRWLGGLGGMGTPYQRSYRAVPLVILALLWVGIFLMVMGVFNILSGIRARPIKMPTAR